MNILKDSFGRRFPYIRLSITDVCNFKCGYCLPNGYQKDKSDNRKFLSVGEIEKLASLNKKLKSRIRDLNKKVESLETSLLGTDAMKTYKKAEKDVQSYLRPTKSSGRKEKVVVYSKK